MRMGDEGLEHKIITNCNLNDLCNSSKSQCAKYDVIDEIPSIVRDLLNRFTTACPHQAEALEAVAPILIRYAALTQEKQVLLRQLLTTLDFDRDREE